MIEISKWKFNSNSPVMFMIDDIANVSIKNKINTDLQIGEDWGQYGTDENSMWDFLNKNLYILYPHIKTTFFLVTDKRSPQTSTTKYSYSEAIDKDEKFINFLNLLHNNKNIELAYHGTTHGIAELTNLKQEWNTYKSLDHAIETIEYGKELYKKVLGKYPLGGKYCGYEKGNYGDSSINKTNFLWWCRDWDAELESNKNKNDLSYELEYFNNTIDIPSNVDGSFLSIYKPQFSKKYLRTVYKYFKKNTLEKQIDALYNAKQIISIQEHSSPYRTDGKIQYPNIVSDIKNLQYIFKLLNKLDVWYATGTEIAEYFEIFKNIVIKENPKGFKFLNNSEKIIKKGTIVTIIFHQTSKIKVEVENKIYNSYEKNNIQLVNIPVYTNILYKVFKNE